MKFSVYDCHVNTMRPGRPIHQVWKTGLTAPEVILLSAIHGREAVTDLKSVRTVETTSVAEYRRLSAAYGKRGRQKLEKLFGPVASGVKLPQNVSSHVWDDSVFDIDPEEPNSADMAPED